MYTKNGLVVAALLSITCASVSFSDDAPSANAQLGVSGSPVASVPAPAAVDSKVLFTIDKELALQPGVDSVKRQVVGNEKSILEVRDGAGTLQGTMERALGDFRGKVAIESNYPRMSIYFRTPEDKGRETMAYAYVDLVALSKVSITVDESAVFFSKRLGSIQSNIGLDISQSLAKICPWFRNLVDIDQFVTLYDILDMKGNRIARSVKSGDATGFDMTIQKYGPKNEEGRDTFIDVVHLTLSPFWKIEVLEPEFVVPGKPGFLDPRVLAMIPAMHYFITKEMTYRKDAAGK